MRVAPAERVEPAVRPGGDWFDVWREAKDAVRKSPDHLIARSEEVVATKDATKIYEFVRDRVQTVPPTNVSAFNSVANSSYYGVRGTLRGGAGSPRDKAEVLKSLYERAGFEATIKRGKLEPSKRSLAILFPRVVRPAFQIADADQTLARWTGMVGVQPPDNPFTFVDQDGSQTKSLATKLSALITPPAALEDVNDLLDDYFPTVVVTVNGTEQFANPVVSDGKFGESYMEGIPFSVNAPTSTDVTVKFWTRKAFGPDRNDPIDLVEKTWKADELVGRRVSVQARPPLPFIQMMPAKIEEVTTFIPMLSVEGGDLSVEDGRQVHRDWRRLHLAW